MSRFSDDYDFDAPNTYGLWEHALAMAMRGKRGQAFLRELKEALEAMPNHRLIAGTWCREGEVCALGALAVHRKRGKGGDWVTAERAIETMIVPERTEVEYWSTRLAVEMFGMQKTLAWAIADQNDERYARSDENRWQNVYDWVCRNLDG